MKYWFLEFMLLHFHTFMAHFTLRYQNDSLPYYYSMKKFNFSHLCICILYVRPNRCEKLNFSIEWSQERESFCYRSRYCYVPISYIFSQNVMDAVLLVPRSILMVAMYVRMSAIANVRMGIMDTDVSLVSRKKYLFIYVPIQLFFSFPRLP